MEISLNIPTSELESFLLSEGLLEAGEEIERIEIPGEGNMNLVIRVMTNRRSFILKQSKPFVNKYPTIPAPIERIHVEHEFYRRVSGMPDNLQNMPAIIGYRPQYHLMILEDLGHSQDYSFLYQAGQRMGKEDLEVAINWLKALHSHPFTRTEVASFPDNLALRKLNHEHIFVVPFESENRLDLDKIDPGLQAIAEPYQRDEVLRRSIYELGKIYLRNGNILLHGDFYPGSWIRTIEGFKVIDPEFSFFGSAEFDLGVLIAHMRMAQQSDTIISWIWERYANDRISKRLVGQFEGIEIIRRLIGLAQLPLHLTLDEKEQLLQDARVKILT